MKNKKYIIGGLVLVVILIYLFQTQFVQKDLEAGQELNKEYPLLNDFLKDRVEGKVVIKKLGMKFGTNGAYYFELDNGLKFSERGESRNFDYKEKFLDRFLEEGDFISKQANNDSIYIYRDGKTYFFLLGKSINE